MYKLLEDGLTLLYYAAAGACLQYFLNCFLESRMHRRSLTGPAVIICYVGMREVWNAFSMPDYTNYGRESLRVICGMGFSFLIIFLITVGFYKSAGHMRLFLVVTFLAVVEVSCMLSYTIWQRGYELLMSLAVRYLEKGYLSPEGLVDTAWLSGYLTLLLTETTVILLSAVILKHIVHSFREKDYDIHRKELFFLLSPGLTGILICMLLRIIMFFMEQEQLRILYDRYPALVLIVPLILLLSLLAVPYGVRVFQGLLDLNRERNDRIVLENQISGLQSQIEEMEHIYAGVRSMKHDMQNTISVITRLAAGTMEESGGEHNGAEKSSRNGRRADHEGNEEDEKRELQEYLEQLGHAFDRLEFRYRTGNAVVDTLLNMKYHEICRVLPELVFEADELLFPESLRIRSYDISVILGNMLDNAAEACRRLREEEKEAALFIRLSSFQKGNMFFLETENSFDGKLEKRAQEEFPATRKEDKAAHGTGLKNIKGAAGKYHGAVDWSVKEGTFLLSVMLQNEEPQ